MGDTAFDGFFPSRYSACIAHSSQAYKFELGPVVQALRGKAGIASQRLSPVMLDSTGDESNVRKSPGANEHVWIVDRIKELVKTKV